MKLRLPALLLAILLAGAAGWAQSASSAPITTQQLTIPLASPPRPVPSATVRVVGNSGNSTYYYWVVSDFLIGDSSPAGPFIAPNAPNVLSAADYVAISPQPVAGASGYDILRTTTPAPPTGACGCAVAIASAGTTVNDQGTALQAYAVTPYNPAAADVTLTNQPTGAGANKLSIAFGGAEKLSASSAGALTATSILGAQLGSVASPIADLVTKGPWLDPRAFGASGSDETTTATCTAGSTAVALAAAQDFANGQGIALSGCGVTAFGGAAITAPTPTVINWCGQAGQMACATAPGSTTYSYRIVVDDGHEGYTAAGSAGTTTTGAATLGTACCNLVGGANYVSWSAPAGITTDVYGYFVYADGNGGPWRLIGLATIPGDATPWAASTGYANGRYVTPLASPNGSYYVAVTGGTSGSTEPAWCTSSATCTVVDGTVTWQRQPFTWMDTGQTVAYQPSWIPAAPPSSGSADVLVTTISSGGGSTTLSLAAPASTSDPTAPAFHDDTAALQAAVDQQSNTCVVTQGAPGDAFTGNCAPISFALGTYDVSAPITFGDYLSLRGQNAGHVNGEEPFEPMFWSSASHLVWISGLHTFGAMSAVYIGRADGDNSVYHLNVQARYTTDFALNVARQEYLDNGTAGLSVVASGDFDWDRAVMLFGGDYASVAPGTWIEPQYANDEAYRAEFVNWGTGLDLRGIVGVPFALPYSRWVDNWGISSVVIDGDARLGAENGGISAVYELGGNGAQQAFDWPRATMGIGLPFAWEGGTIVVRDSESAIGGYGSNAPGLVTVLNNSFPQTFVANGDRAVKSPSNLIDACNGVAGSSPCALPAGYAGSNLDTLFEGAIGALSTIQIDDVQTAAGGQLCAAQSALMPLETSSRCLVADAAPTSGLWVASGSQSLSFGPLLRNGRPANGQPVGWLLAPGAGTYGSPERSAPTWQANHTYTLATAPAGQGDDFVAAGGNAFYVSAVTSGSTCTSGASAPSWNATFNATTGAGATTTDGSCTWTLETYGSGQSNTPGYVAPYFAVPAAAFNPVGFVGPTLSAAMGGTGISSTATFPTSGTVAVTSQLPLTGTTASIGGAALPAGGCATGTAAVSGATTAMAVSASPAVDPGSGVTWDAFVSAAGTVTVRVCNVTASSLTPSATTYAVRVMQ